MEWFLSTGKHSRPDQWGCFLFWRLRDSDPKEMGTTLKQKRLLVRGHARLFRSFDMRQNIIIRKLKRMHDLYFLFWYSQQQWILQNEEKIYCFFQIYHHPFQSLLLDLVHIKPVSTTNFTIPSRLCHCHRVHPMRKKMCFKMCRNRCYFKSFYRFSQEQLWDSSFLEHLFNEENYFFLFFRTTKYTNGQKEIKQWITYWEKIHKKRSSILHKTHM